MLYRSMSDTNKPFVSVARKRGNELCYLTRSSSSSSSVNPCSFGDFFFFLVMDSSLSSPVLSRGRTQLVSGKRCLGTCSDSNVKLPWLAPQRRSFSFSSHSHAYLSSLPSQVCFGGIPNCSKHFHVFFRPKFAVTSPKSHAKTLPESHRKLPTKPR